MWFGLFKRNSRNSEPSHEWARARMSAFLDGQLQGEEGTLLETHLQGCGPCSDELRALRMTRQLLRAMPATPLPRAFTLQAVPSPSRLPRSFFFLRAATAMAATAFVALLAASAVLTGGVPAAAPAPSQYGGAATAAPASSKPSANQAPAAQSAPQRASAPAAASAPTAAAAPLAPRGTPAAPAGQATPSEGAAPAPQPSAPMAQPAAGTGAAAQDTAAPGATGQAKPAPAPAPPPAPTVAPAPEPLTASRPSGGGAPLLPFQLAAAALTALFAVASGAIWWIARRRP